ncbi:MAG: HDOD domain-containing protein [Pseudomonadota bacterium]
MENAARVSTPQSLVDNVLQLISLPEIYLRLQQTIDDPLHTRPQVAAVVAYDPALSARVLRIANSSYYGFPRNIDTVESAVGIIGELDLRNLVLATTVIGSMNNLEYAGVDIDEFWLHSLRAGITARLIAALVGGCDKEIMFLAGILHDLGILVMYQQDSSLAAAINRQINKQHQLRDQAERELLGFDHAEVGSLLIRAWGLSEDLCQLTLCHHQYQMATEQARGSQVLSLANQLAEHDPGLEVHDDIRYAALMESLSVSAKSLTEVVEMAAQQCDEIRSIILGS